MYKVYIFGIFPLLDSTVERDRKYVEKWGETGNYMLQKFLAVFKLEMSPKTILITVEVAVYSFYEKKNLLIESNSLKGKSICRLLGAFQILIFCFASSQTIIAFYS